MRWPMNCELRGWGADRGFDNRSLKAQMKLADRSLAHWAIIIGEDELAAHTVTLRDLRGDTGQSQIGRDEIVHILVARINAQKET